MRKVKKKFPLAIIFDLDGTLIDSAPDLLRSLNIILSDLGSRPVSLIECKKMIGDGVPTLVERAVNLTENKISSSGLEKVVKNFQKIYEENPVRLTTVYPGVFPMLSELENMNIKLGICTNKPLYAARNILAELKLDKFFGCVVGGDSLVGVKKPNPDIRTNTMV